MDKGTRLGLVKRGEGRPGALEEDKAREKVEEVICSKRVPLGA